MENNETQAVDDLMALIDESENENYESENEEVAEENETKEQTSDKVSEFESYKAEQESVINALKAELETLKSAKSEDKKVLSEAELKRAEILKELGLDDINEKLAMIEKFNAEQQERESQTQMINQFNDLEAELKKDYPNADFHALGKLGASLGGLASGDKEAWRTLAKLVNKQGLNRADENLKGQTSFNASDTFSKLQKGEATNDYEIGKALLALSE